MNCGSCGHENPPASRFCLECGASLGVRCAGCGTELPAAAKFCNACGQPVASGTSPAGERSPRAYTPEHLAEKILAGRSALEGERKTITAVFADIQGSMELLAELDPEEARRLVDPALELMMEAVHRYEGYVAQSTGDGIFALFGAPIAHEDHAQRACFAALRMQEQIRRYAERLRREQGVNLQVRVGLNTGEVVLRSIRTDDLHTDYVPIGHATSLAARMESLAAPGSIVVSDRTQKLAAGYFQLESLGAAKVKGVSEPVPIYEVVGVGPLRTRLAVAERRGLVRFVGRQGELSQLNRAWGAAQGGHGQVVAVVGEAGVGKSRLFHELKGRLDSGCLVLEAYSVSHGKAQAYLPVIELLRSYFGIALDDGERRRREKVTGKVLTLDRALEDALPYLFALLGITDPMSSLSEMDPGIRRRRTQEAVRRVLVRESLDRPLVVVFEDLHWIDAETQAFLELLVEGLATVRLLLLVNYRPQYRHEWGSKTYYTQLRLDPLGPEEAQELLTALLGEAAGADLAPLRSLIFERTEGNPFFMEEMVQALAEEGVLVGERGGYRLERAPSELHIPATVEGVLAARIDRLPAEEKELLQTLAVVGKEFPFGLARGVAERGEGDLHRLLSHLQAGEFLYEQPAFPEPEYTFKHALTQQVAYESLLVERRKGLHERTGRAIEALYPGALDAHYGDLAHHYGRSEDGRKAVEYLHLAGRQAVDRSAYGDAVDYLTRGLERLGALPEAPERDQQELLLQTALGAVWMVTKSWSAPEVEAAYARARELCARVGDPAQLFTALSGLFSFHLSSADHFEARDLAQELLRVAERSRDPALLTVAHVEAGTSAYFRAELGTARAHLEEAIALYAPERHRTHEFLYGGTDPGVFALIYLGFVLRFLGYWEQFHVRIQEALQLAHQLSHPFSIASALLFVAIHHAEAGEPERALEQAEALIALATEHGFPRYLGAGVFVQARALVELGRVEEGLARMRTVVDAMRDAGLRMNMSVFLQSLADALGRAGLAGEGLTSLAEALDHVERTGEQHHAPLVHATRGDLLLAASEGNEAEAENCYRQALDLARSQEAKSWELVAATRLARLWQRQGKRKEARELLAPLYGWFTEGFDTRDLKEAKALLDELS